MATPVEDGRWWLNTCVTTGTRAQALLNYIDKLEKAVDAKDECIRRLYEETSELKLKLHAARDAAAWKNQVARVDNGES